MKKDLENKIAGEAEKKYQNFSIKKLPGSEVEIEGEIVAPTLEYWYKEVLRNAAENIEVAGFRIGKAPEELVEKQMGEMKILEKAAQNALDEVYPMLLLTENIRAIGTPIVGATKLARGNPLGFKARTAVFPEVDFGNSDYKKMAAEVDHEGKVTDIEDKEVDAVIEDLRKVLAGEVTPPNGNMPSATEKIEPTLPEINDEFAKKFGDYKNVDEMKRKIRENIIEGKNREAREKRRGIISEKLISAAKIDVPEILIESELETMVNRFKHDVEHSGLTLDGYLSQVKKTIDDIKKDWRASAEKRARLQLILGHVATVENIFPSEEEVKKEMDHILSHHKEADRFRVRMYVEHAMKNEKVFDFLENQ